MKTSFKSDSANQDWKLIFGHEKIPSYVLGFALWKDLFEMLASDPRLRAKYQKQIEATFEPFPTDLLPFDNLPRVTPQIREQLKTSS
jgi:hypothetical protein